MNNEPDVYQVEVNVQIRRVSPSGYHYNDRMEFRNVSDLGPLNFRQIADLLLKFQELSDDVVRTTKKVEENNGD